MTLPMCSYDTPLEVLPGDELKMTCEFSSMDRHYTTKDGLGSYDEMCTGLITYYPKEARFVVVVFLLRLCCVTFL